MIKSMTGFSKFEAFENGIKSIVEIKSLNGRYLEINPKMPKMLSHKELEMRDIIKSFLLRGTVTVSVNLEYEAGQKPFMLDEDSVMSCYETLNGIKKKLKLKEPVTLSHVLNFSGQFLPKDNTQTGDAEWFLTRKALKEALKQLDKMRSMEGKQLLKDFQTRIKKISELTAKIEALGVKRIPAEKDKIRQRIAQLFESDEIDENRIQMEIAFQANKLDISEECVRLRSHIKFFHETLKANEPIGQKLTFLLQEMNREINTIGSKSDDAEISQNVVLVKEEIERVREQAQNVE